MKPIYRCDYCDQMGTAEEIMAHEENCSWTYNRKSCRTCRRRDSKSLMQYKCLLDIEIPENHIIEFCGKYEWDEKSQPKYARNIFSPFLGI